MEDSFEMFGGQHILVLIITVVLCILSSILYRRSGSKVQRKTAFLLGTVILLSDLVHYIVYYALGLLNVFEIPLHLCALAVYLCFLFGVKPMDWLGQVLYALCLPGAWCALIFPDWTGYPFFSYLSMHGFLIHALIVIFITMQLSAGFIKPHIRKIWKPVLFLCVMAPIAAVANRFLGTNFMFLSNTSPGSPLDFLNQLAGGNHVLYLVYFGLLTLIGMAVLLLPFSFLHKKK